MKSGSQQISSTFVRHALAALAEIDYASSSGIQLEWVRAEVDRRVHQPAFRAMVLRAYESQCTVCRLRHPELLDAAYITADSDPMTVASVNNGMAMCKIHHAAYDQNFMGIRPDYQIVINERLLDEVDGPMLRHGLQEMHGQRLELPRSYRDYPDPARLEQRFLEFTSR